MWIGVQLAVYVGLILGYALLLLLAVRHRSAHGRAEKLLEAILLLAALWTLALGSLTFLFPRGWWAFSWQRLAQIGLVLLALLTADYAEVFVERASRRGLRVVMVVLLTLGAVALDVRPFPWPRDISPIPLIRLGPTDLATLLLLTAWAIGMGGAWWVGAQALRRATGSKHRNRIRYLQTSLLSFTVGDLLIFVGGLPDLYVGLAARLLGLSILTFALLRYDLPDLRRLSLMVLRVVLLAGLTAALYSVVLGVAGLAVGGFVDPSRLTSVIPVFILAILTAAMLDVVLAPRLNRSFDRTVLGQPTDIQRALRTYSQQVSLILDRERLADTTLNWLRTTMRVERAAFLLFAVQSGGWFELKVLRATTSPVPSPQSFAGDSRFVVHFRNIGRPLSQYDLDMLSWFQVMRAEERQWLKELGVDLYVPVLVADRPVALLALGPKADGQPYSEEDLESLTILAGQTGTALENSRLLDDLRAVQADLQALNSELAETNRQLVRLDQVKADFVTIASHELRTPLSQIFGYSDVLAGLEGEELGDAQVVAQFISGIARGARRLKRVVDAMVDMSLIETGALKIQCAMVSLEEIVGNAVQTVQSAAAGRDLSFEVGDLSGLPLIWADGARLEQAFTSLVNNAVKFTPDGRKIVIAGRLIPALSDAAYVEVQVADEGIGIDADQRALIFEKFYRPENPLLHSTDETGFKGAGPGLGLAIVRGIVEAHGGRIWVESLGRDEEALPGSTFYVRLPVDGPPGGIRKGVAH